MIGSPSGHGFVRPPVLNFVFETWGAVDMEIRIVLSEDVVDPVRELLPPPGMGILEAIALDAILSYFDRLKKSQQTNPASKS